MMSVNDDTNMVAHQDHDSDSDVGSARWRTYFSKRRVISFSSAYAGRSQHTFTVNPLHGEHERMRLTSIVFEIATEELKDVMRAGSE